MNPDSPIDPRKALESSLTALLLGELAHDQAAALHQKLAQDAELAALYDRLKHTINLVRETSASPAAQTANPPTPLKLSDQRRQKLLQHFKTVAPKEFTLPRRRARRWLVPVSIAAAAMVMGAALLQFVLTPRFALMAKLGADSETRSARLENIPQALGARAWKIDRGTPLRLPRGGQPAPEPGFRDVQGPNRNGRTEQLGLQNKEVVAVTPLPNSLVAASPLQAAGTAIVLPKGGEPADTSAKPVVSQGAQVAFSMGPSTRAFYDDSTGQAGGSIGGGVGGRSGGSAGRNAGPTDRGLAGDTAANAFTGQPKWVGSLDASGGVGAVKQSKASSEPSRPTIADGSSASPFLGRYGYVAQPSALMGPSEPITPAPIPPPVASAPAPHVLNAGNLATTAPAPALAPTEGVPPADPAASSPALPTDGETGKAEPSPAPETAVSESVLRQADAITPREKLAEFRFQAQGGTPPANVGQALAAEKKPAQPVAPVELAWSDANKTAPDAPTAGGKFELLPAETAAKQRDLPMPITGSTTVRSPASQNGLLGAVTNYLATAPAAGEVGAAGSATFGGYVALSGSADLGRSSGIDTRALPGLANADKDKVPMLGDVSAMGRLYRTDPDATRARPNDNTKQPTSPQVATWAGVESGIAVTNMVVLAPEPTIAPPPAASIDHYSQSHAWNFGSGNANVGNLTFSEDERRSGELAAANRKRQQSAAGGEKPGGTTGVYNLDVVGYAKVPAQPARPTTAAQADGLSSDRSTYYRLLSPLGEGTKDTPRGGRSSIALPAAEGETRLALNDSTDAEQKSRPYFEAKQNLGELQRFRQILDMKIAAEKIDVELPKTTMVEIVDKATPQPVHSPSLWGRLSGKATGESESTARIKVERDQTDVSGMADHGATLGYDPYFIQTEFETMQSEAVLGKVIKDLNLNETWGKKQGGRTLTTPETMALLKKNLDLRPEGNSGLIDVGVKSDKPEEAAKIANAIAEAYKAHRSEQRAQMSEGGIRALEEGFQAQEEKVRLAQAKVDRLRKELSVPPNGEVSKVTQANQPDATPPKPAAPAAVPQPEVQTGDNAFSTFSLNVSDVSFKLAAASLEKGVMPEPGTVRSEEFINAFDYRDPEPPPGVPVAFAWERAQYPFAQNRDLLRFSIKTAALGRQPGRPLNLVLLLDNSGSMERADRVQIIREALRVLAEQLQPHDKLSVITFARTPRLFADGAPGSDAGAIAMALTELTPQGGTNLEDAMNLAYQTALRHYLADGVNRVVLLTDGAANLGDVNPEALKQKVEANRKQGIALDCFGIGWEGYNDDLLEVLSRNGDGRYGFVNTPEEAATEFAGQLAGALHVAASDVKVQVEFNPARVTAYRQIGYAKHQLKKEQFRDNTVDAAEIGAAESGNALYVIAVNPAGEGPLATVRVRYKVPGTSDYHEHEWPVPYTGNAVPLEQASPAMRLAATASAFSEWLVTSPYAAEVTPDRLLGYLSGVPEVCGADARPKKLEWMIRQAKSIAGK